MNENANNPSPGCPPAEPAKTVPRRQFVEWFSIALGGVCAAIIGLPIVGFIVAPLFGKKQEQWISLGKKDDFEIGKTVNIVTTLRTQPFSPHLAILRLQKPGCLEARMPRSPHSIGPSIGEETGILSR